MRKTLVACVLGAATLVLSPFSACGPSFSFGEKEMTAAIEGTWKMTLPALGDAPSREVTMRLAQSTHPVHASNGFIANANACGTRSLVKNAGACIDMTELPLEVTFLSTTPLDGETWKNITGAFRVAGENFRRGELTIQLDKRSLIATIGPTGDASEGVMLRDVGENVPLERTDVALVRVAK